jgi:hypothetical protein
MSSLLKNNSRQEFAVTTEIIGIITDKSSLCIECFNDDSLEEVEEFIYEDFLNDHYVRCENCKKWL